MYYFASDMHLGSPQGALPSLERERRLVRWLDEVSTDARAIYLAGDVFDFWFEYRMVVPKGFTRFLGKLAELTDRGVEIHLYMGNHDMWTLGYLEHECGVRVHREAQVLDLYGRRIYIAHGDRIMDDTHPMHRLRGAMLRSSALRWLFSRLVPPSLALRFGQWWSGYSRTSRGTAHIFIGEQEPIVQFAREYASTHPDTDYFVFGHIHCAEDYPLDGRHRIIFLGDWLLGSDYARLSPDGQMQLMKFE